MEITVRVKRQAGRDRASTEQDYQLSVDPDKSTVLDVLNLIQWQQDGSLVFRRNCRNAICGSCAMHINGRAGLACQQKVGEAIGLRRVDPITNEPIAVDPVLSIAPMQNLPVIKDLVVDMSKFWQNLERVDPYVSSAARKLEDREFLQTPTQRQKLEEAANCILCGSCYSDCNALSVNENFVGPHALAKAYRVMADNRDNDYGDRTSKYNQPDFVWGCTRCYNCNEVCPVGVQPLDRISQIKHEILQDESLPESRPQRHRHVMVSLVKRDGWIDESKFGVEVVGNNFKDIRGLFSLVPLGLRMVISGKMPWPWLFKPSAGTKKVRALIEAVQRQEKANSTKLGKSDNSGSSD
jgi:succinate dehydrogenase / fumarate reductase iron-sulfur subunit